MSLIGRVMRKLNTVLGSLGDQSQQFDKALTSLSDLVDGLAARKTDISAGLAYVNEAAGAVADLFPKAAPRSRDFCENDRASGIVVADHESSTGSSTRCPTSIGVGSTWACMETTSVSTSAMQC